MNYLTIPDKFDDFKNNIESIAIGLWYDGDYSEIYNWVASRYVKNQDFEIPNGYVFGAQVVLITDQDMSTEAYYICFVRGYYRVLN